MLVVPQHNPFWLANFLASLDVMSGGRLILGAGVGWSAREYEALGYDFTTRGRRLDEILYLLRTAWRDDPASFAGDPGAREKSPAAAFTKSGSLARR